MSQTLYIVRHGKTLFNERRLIQGWVDSPLTDLGHEQAKRVGAFCQQRGISFDYAYASTLARTHQTLEHITDMPFERVADLREWGFGSFEAERVELMPAYPWGNFFEPYGGERQDRFQERVMAALTRIMARPNHQRVLVVSHGSVSRIILHCVAPETSLELHEVPGNCSLATYHVDEGRFSFESLIEQQQMQQVLGW
ncbi:histidine phosphatase family protein [Collinsella sp. zg1085]|uniref:histidine phosphatase family protein n=1 Tax=Collinsella sp. zg1085 TaxID=2844380 RepID=UPI001C0D0EB5|nr:histidine phosphatase family protein [Collinsella sp. zg1085]QWT17186.1 histidine phosphatase family protein [Collinsella sp. zg1085]